VNHVPSPSPDRSETRYRIGVEIGRGGLGRVVEARDTRLDRDVAIKLALPGLAPELAERFAREARVTARLDHPYTTSASRRRATGSGNCSFP
jgi:serine/threonine protein kinase